MSRLINMIEQQQSSKKNNNKKDKKLVEDLDQN